MTVAPAVSIGTRGSALAMVQARAAAEALAPFAGTCRLVAITTRGDRISARRPHAGWVDADGQFTRELERAMLQHEIDIAVHSYKDLPTAPVDGLIIGAVLPRADARDCLITAARRGLRDLPSGARVGTSSPRRAAQLQALRPDVVPVPIRGNVESRIARVDAGDVDAVILAAAGLDRLGIDVPDVARLSFDVMLPAPAQGALAIQVRADDARLVAAAASCDHRPSRLAAEAERALLRRIGGGCLAPLGAYAEVTDGAMRLRAAYGGDADGWRRADVVGSVDDVADIVTEAAERLMRPAVLS